MSRQQETRCLHQYLEDRQQIAIVWSIEDVQHVRPDLDDEQSWIVLQNCKANHDATLGMNWEMLEIAAESIYPEITQF